MIKKAIDRLEGIPPEELIEVLVDLIETAEELSEGCQNYLDKVETKETLNNIQKKWRIQLDQFYDKYIS